MALSIFRRCTLGVAMALALASTTVTSFGQAVPAPAVKPNTALPTAVERALIDADRATMAELESQERAWRAVFREARSRARLIGFVGETLGFFEKLQQVHDRALSPAETEARIKGLFRARILDEDTVCRLMEKSLREFCDELDEQDQALLIKLRIDRAATRTTLSRSVIDPQSFKKPIHAAASAAVEAVENDLSRSIASILASEVIGMGAKRAARDLGLLQTEEGSWADFFGGLLIEAGVGAVVDAVTDPTDDMVNHLEMQLTQAERAILDGTVGSPGYLTTLRRVAKERTDTRRKILSLEFTN